MNRIYLAAPYTHTDQRVVKLRVHLADIFAGYLMEKGYCVFSPLSHSHPISMKMKRDSFDHDFWLKQDLPFLEWADLMVVMKLPGWKESKGIGVETQEAKKLNKPIRFVKEHDIYRIVNL